MQGFSATGDPEIDEIAVELGLGRRRLLSELGRADAAQRWHDGDYGPGSAMARSTRRVCRDCGFYLPLRGALGLMFGVCGNELSADGHVVDAEYGCGAHSDTPAPAGAGSPLYDPYDDGVLDVTPPQAPSDEQQADGDDEQTADDEQQAEATTSRRPTTKAIRRRRSRDVLGHRVFRSTAARINALNAFSSILSSSRKSMARRVFPSRLELNSPDGSFNDAPLANVTLT